MDYRHPLAIVLAFLLGVIISIAVLAMNINFNTAYNRLVCLVEEGDILEEQYVIPVPKQKVENDHPSVGTEIKLDRTKHLFFHYHSHFLVWLFFMTLLVAVSWAFFLPVLQSVKKILKVYNFQALQQADKNLTHDAEVDRRIRYKYWILLECMAIALVILVMAVLLSGGGWIRYVSQNTYFLNFFETMDHFEILLKKPLTVSATLIVLANITTLMTIAGIYLINRAVIFIEQEYPTYKELIERFGQLNKTLDFFLFVLAIIVSGGVVTAAINREMIIQAVPDFGSLLAPIEFVYLYSLVFTIFLALIYIPVYYQLKRKGQQILTETINYNEIGIGKHHETGIKAPFAEDILLMKNSTATNLKVSLAILGPVISSLAGNLSIL